MIGLFWKKYAGYASGLSMITRKTSETLYSARNISKMFKPTIEKFRGRLATKHLLKRDKSYGLIPIIENLERLIQWLNASKYFSQEHMRLLNWLSFLAQKSPIYVSNFLGSTNEVSSHFIKTTKSKLGVFTSGVAPFLENAIKMYKNREDIIFCTRSEEEYFLNMVAVEILNRSYREKFNNTVKKVVLLPSCMSSPKSGTCQAHHINSYDIECAGCTSGCKVNQIKKKVKKNGMELKLIPHISNFSKFLKTLQNNRETGVVGVGCVLNLLSKAYEMISMGIPSQFIFLDYNGCQKHWPDIDQPTDLNVKELLNVLKIQHPGITNLQLVLN